MIQFLFGLAVAYTSVGAAWLARRAWVRGGATPAPELPRSDAQRQNQAVTEELWATTPKVHSMHVQRRNRRGRGPAGQEEMYRESL